MIIHLFRVFPKRKRRKGWKKDERTNNNSIQAKIGTKRREKRFIRQLKINYLATYATILNNKATKPTERNAKMNEDKPKSYKIIITIQDKHKCK